MDANNQTEGHPQMVHIRELNALRTILSDQIKKLRIRDTTPSWITDSMNTVEMHLPRMGGGE